MSQREMNDAILEELKEIKEMLKKVQESCDKMSAHVDFVDCVYKNVQSPFNWFMNKVRQISGIGGNCIQLDNFKKIK